jgi:hypothetical protein
MQPRPQGQQAPGRRRQAAALAFCLLLTAGGQVFAQDPPSAAAPVDPQEQKERTRYIGLLQKKLLLERETSLKTLQLELATDAAPYLIFDLEDQEVRVYVRVTPVRGLPVEHTEMEVLAADDATSMAAPAWVDQQLDLVAKSGDGKASKALEPPAIPQEKDEDFNPRAVTPEIAGLQEVEYPSSYTLLYRQGIAVHIIGGGQGQNGSGTWVQERIERLASLLIRPDLPAAEEMQPVHTWIHLTLPESEARALYPIAYTGMRAMLRLPGDPSF